MSTYRLGSMTGGERPLIVCETDETVAMVVSDAGPAIVGEMDEDEAREKFPEAFAEPIL